MSNEVVLLVSLSAAYCFAVLSHRLFGKAGVFGWIAVCTILANIEVTATVHAFGMEQTLGNTLFASSFLATDILSECYSKEDARKGVWIGILSSIAFILYSVLWQLYMPGVHDTALPLIQVLFRNSPRILAASLAAYCVSEFLDVRLYHFFWKLTEAKSGSKNSFLWLRNNAATLISQAVNIVLFNAGAFAGRYDMTTLVSITLSCYVIYFFTSLLDTPFVYLARRLQKR